MEGDGKEGERGRRRRYLMPQVRRDESTPTAPEFCIIKKFEILEDRTEGIIANMDEEGNVEPPSWFL
jgi:hypothetical protein